MRFSTRTPKPAWIEGTVDRKADHVSLSYGERRRVMALVAPHREHGFTVQFLKSPETMSQPTRILEEVRQELTFYLLNIVGPDSWTFVQYHCDTPANQLSRVHWAWHPKPMAPQPAARRSKA